jgi:glucose/arabinose dehydrogenase
VISEAWYRSGCWRRAGLGAALGCALLGADCGGGSGGGQPTAEGPLPVLSVERVFPNLDFTNPVALLQAPNDASRWFVVEQAGRVMVFNNNPAATTATPFININDGRVTSGGEMGLLGMAFHPAFPLNPRVYLSYTNDTSGRVSRISEFTSTDGGLTLNPNPERILLVINQPETNHKGGNIAFGPDGFLYIGMGDGGGGNDQVGTTHGPIGNAQNMKTLLGKMLRIDVSPTIDYAIPAGNRFPVGNSQCGVNGTGTQECPEIYASGFRNPWRWSFDRVTGELWVGDVGQGAREEIDRVVPGGNYGWVCFEGTLPVGPPCGSEPNLLPPVAEYGRSEGSSVTGGYVYRGQAIAGLAGRYVFGDFVSGRIWHIAGDTQPTAQITGGFASGLSISSFGEGNDGEIYVVHYGGQFYRLTGS